MRGSRKTRVLLWRITALASAIAVPGQLLQDVLHETSPAASYLLESAATTDAVLNSFPTESLPSADIQTPTLRVQSRPIRFLKHVFQIIESKAKFHHCTNVSRLIGDEIRKSSEALVPISLASPSYTPPGLQSTTIHRPSLISSPKLLEAPTSTTNITLTPAHHHNQILLAFIITSFIFVLVCAPLFLFTQVLNPRRRADWAARREECRNRRLYRQAAQQQKLRNWINRLTGNRLLQTSEEPLHTWNEKRLATQQEPLQLDVRHEILARRLANSITRAEEGRVEEMVENFLTQGRQQNRASRSSSNVTGPPPYEEDDGVVVNGFQYVVQRSNDTPGSSVIDTSPRPSLYTRDSDSEKN
ncbi:MAG: hypothetical protein Q9187_000672 [Circinaria calcarea]